MRTEEEIKEALRKKELKFITRTIRNTRERLRLDSEIQLLQWILGDSENKKDGKQNAKI